MRWKNRRQSENVEDRRATGGVGRKAAVGGGLGVILIVVLGLIQGENPLTLLSKVAAAQQEQQAPAGDGEVRELTAQEVEAGEFAATILADTEDVWNELFPEVMGRAYQEPTMVLFSDAVHSACGTQDSAVGPFYCPGDNQVYIDLTFFDTLARRLDAPGDFAQAYVIAHEVGHHIQTILGISGDVHSKKRGLPKADANELSVRQELQADFLAGVWAHHAQRTKRFLEEGDIEEALRAASMIGDDTLQKRSSGRVMPESFTHGTSEQRVRWFKLGFQTGDLGRMDTFAVPKSQL